MLVSFLGWQPVGYEERAMFELIQVTVKVTDDCPDLAWADGERVSLPRALVQEGPLAEWLQGERVLRVSGIPDHVSPDAPKKLRLKRAFIEGKPGLSRLPVSYKVIPPWIRSHMAVGLAAWKRRRLVRTDSFPRWPLDLSADFLSDLAGVQSSPFREDRTPVVLTHDLDSEEGLQGLVALFLDLEEAMGARSTNFIVPFEWPIDHGLLAEVHDRRHEVGVHGYDHSCRTPFAPDGERRMRIAAAKPLVDRYGCQGYRAPAFVRTASLIRDLADQYRYDSSIPTSGGLFPVLNNGCASARPFVVQGIAELPVSLPRDGTLLFMRFSPAEILEMWKSCAERISISGGVVVLLTHCEKRFSGDPKMLDVYTRFLDFVCASDKFEFSTPAEILARMDGMVP